MYKITHVSVCMEARGTCFKPSLNILHFISWSLFLNLKLTSSGRLPIPPTSPPWRLLPPMPSFTLWF